MARIAYTALFLNWTPDATEVPTTTQIGSLITNYYQQIYGIAYPLGYYNDSDSDTSDPQTIVRAKEIEALMIIELSDKVQKWHEAGINSQGGVEVMPSFEISDKLEKKIKSMIGRSYSRVANIRVMGSEYDDAGVI